ncbi:MAG: oligopeptidase B, partial [Gemmatimonadales bacterium]
MRTRLVSALALLLTPLAAAQSPPVARVVPRIDTLHGEIRQDDYFWLREKTNPDVRAYLEAENAYTAEGMKHTEALQEQLYREILGRVKETDLTVPY